MALEMEYKKIPVEKIKDMNGFTPQTEDIHHLRGLANSLRFHGMKFPILVRKIDNGYLLIDGRKRLIAWKTCNLGTEIPCLVLSKHEALIESSLVSFEPCVPIAEKENSQKVLDLYTMVSVNHIRSDIDKNVRDNIVKYLHETVGLGYSAIAQRIGYSKAGVQKILNRMKARKETDVATEVMPGHSLKRLQTQLGKLAETIPSSLDNAEAVKEAMEVVSSYISNLLKEE